MGLASFFTHFQAKGWVLAPMVTGHNWKSQIGLDSNSQEGGFVSSSFLCGIWLLVDFDSELAMIPITKSFLQV